jgi:hypothetical protein
MGFINGALIQVLPYLGETVFNLCDENVRYSDLFNATKEMGGTLIRAYSAYDLKCKCPGFMATGKYLNKCGFEFGDELIARFEYGRVRVRKVSGNVRLIHVGRSIKEHTGEAIPAVLLTGAWLSDIGFEPGTPVAVAPGSDCITLTARHKSGGYIEDVKFARQNKMQLIQVVAHKGAPRIRIKGLCAYRAGFTLGDIFAASYEYGLIKLQKFDPQRFGF